MILLSNIDFTLPLGRSGIEVLADTADHPGGSAPVEQT